MGIIFNLFKKAASLGEKDGFRNYSCVSRFVPVNQEDGYLVTTNGMALAAVRLTHEGITEPVNVPIAAVAEAGGISFSDDGMMAIVANRTGGIQFRIPQVDYPAIDQVFPSVLNTRAIALNAALLKKIAEAIADKRSQQVTLLVNQNDETAVIGVLGDNGIGIICPMISEKDASETARHKFDKAVAAITASNRSEKKPA